MKFIPDVSPLQASRGAGPVNAVSWITPVQQHQRCTCPVAFLTCTWVHVGATHTCTHSCPQVFGAPNGAFIMCVSEMPCIAPTLVLPRLYCTASSRCCSLPPCWCQFFPFKGKHQVPFAAFWVYLHDCLQCNGVMTDAISLDIMGSSIHLATVAWKSVCLIILLGRVNQNNWGILSIWVKSPLLSSVLLQLNFCCLESFL